MRFAHPALLWGLLVVPLLALAFTVDAARRHRLLERIGDAPLLREMIRTASSGRRLARSLCITLAAALLVVGLARPQYGGRSQLVSSRGIDVVLALDLSKSMLARDVHPSRLARAKAELDHLLDDSLVGDRLGMIGFAGTTVSYPLTTDSASLELFYGDLQPYDMPVGGTAIGKAVTAALGLLQESASATDRTRVIVLFTDGEDTVSDPLAAAEQANRLGVRIYTVGIGTRSGEPVPQLDGNGQPVGYMHKPGGDPGYVTATLDEALLRQIAEKSGGQYFHLDPERFGLEGLSEALGRLKKADAESRLVKSYDEASAWFLFPAFVLLLVEACLGDRKSRRAARLEEMRLAHGSPRAPRSRAQLESGPDRPRLRSA